MWSFIGGIIIGLMICVALLDLVLIIGCHRLEDDLPCDRCRWRKREWDEDPCDKCSGFSEFREDI